MWVFCYASDLGVDLYECCNRLHCQIADLILVLLLAGAKVKFQLDQIHHQSCELARWSLMLPDNGFFAGARIDLIPQATPRRRFQPIKTFGVGRLVLYPRVRFS